MKFRDLFPAKKIKCFSCQRKVKNENLAIIMIKCLDGNIERPICKDCEIVFNKNIGHGENHE